MAGLHDLAREYEARRFPPTRQLDLHGEGPEAARQRALRWIQTFAHEEPGSELLLVVERGGRRRGASPVRRSIERLLETLEGRLIDGWQRFTDDSIALRVAIDPDMHLRPSVQKAAPDPMDGRTRETAGAALLSPDEDIPLDLLPLAHRTAELRRAREGWSVSLMEVVLRKIWIEAQAAAMTRGISFEAGLQELLRAEESRLYEDEE